MASEKPGTDKGDELSSGARQMQEASPYIAAVWQLIGGAVFGVLAGYFLDKWLGTTPWILVGLTTVGIVVGFYAFIRSMAKLNKK